MKTSRQQKILEIIENSVIDTQEELATILKDQGYDVTQATVSRDIRELKLTKIATESGKQKYASITKNTVEVSERLIRVFKDAVLKVEAAQNTIVIKTLTGMGMAVAVALDNMENAEILGSIAGDDTVFCVAKSNMHALEFVQKLINIINAK